MWSLTRASSRHFSLLRSKPNAAPNALLTVEPLAFNITLCQVMVSLSQKQSVSREAEGEWLTPLRTFVRETLGSGVKLSYQQLHMLLGTVWKMVLTQRSRSKHVQNSFHWVKVLLDLITSKTKKKSSKTKWEGVV